MKINRVSAIVAVAAVGLVGSAVPAVAKSGHDNHKPREIVLGTELKTRNEVPPTTSGDKGNATIFIDDNQICWEITSRLSSPATAAHIHKAPKGTNGPVVVPLSTPNTLGRAMGCADVDPTLVADISAHPSDYYVNVHTTAFPGGDIRGQLKKTHGHH